MSEFSMRRETGLSISDYEILFPPLDYQIPNINLLDQISAQQRQLRNYVRNNTSQTSNSLIPRSEILVLLDDTSVGAIINLQLHVNSNSISTDSVCAA